VNPLVRTYLQQIEQAIARLGEVLADSRAETVRQQEARDRLQQQVWSKSKEITVLQEAAADYDALREANERYRLRHAQLEEHLKKVLAYTRALAEEVRQ
jgi:predicted nuclease with TOPRIM domain